MKSVLSWMLAVLAVAGTTNAAESSAAGPQVVLETSKGDIVIELFTSKAPLTVDNFLSYVDDKFYNGTIFHRVIPNFMIQGGGFTSDMKQKRTKTPIKNEADNGLKNDRGTIAMARTQDPHSATAQFFINTVNNDFLNYKSQTRQGWGYAVFGRVIKGLKVVDMISGVKTGTHGRFGDVPAQPIVILKARRLK
ncbi:MAG: peptidyl-prolyl cis-trans isomerase [Deltaproteobacteria bacterium]|nr:MAG: peptidyl-prolyl cis-trans isomerase [Deltaproteobacteria bacterium]